MSTSRLDPMLHSAFTSSIGNLTVIRRKGSARSSMVLDSGNASRVGPAFLRTLRGDISLGADLFEGIPMALLLQKANLKEERKYCTRRWPL